MYRLFQMLTGNVDRTNRQTLRRAATRRTVACRPGLEAMEIRLAPSSFMPVDVQQPVTQGLEITIRPGIRPR